MVGISRRFLVSFLWVGFISLCQGCNTSPGHLKTPVTVTFDNPFHLIVFEAKVAGQGPFRFILDSGATGTVIDVELAKTLGLPGKNQRTRRSTAAGSQVTYTTLESGVDFNVAPGFDIHVNRVVTAPFTEISRVIMGEHFDGIIGSSPFFDYVIEVDYEKKKLTFQNAKSFVYQGNGSVLDLTFPRNLPKLPFIKATLTHGDRRLENYDILVDSGGQTMGTASVATRREWDHLIQDSDRIVDHLGATGLSNDAEGTTHEAFTAQMDRFKMGPFEFADPIVSYSAGGPSVAVMGATLLHRFTVTFDYSRKQLILEPNGLYSDPPKNDQSGLFLATTEDNKQNFKVLFVSPGTPGDKAGLKRGDIIQAINGKPSKVFGMLKARYLFCETRDIKLEVQRGGSTFETVIATRPLYDQ